MPTTRAYRAIAAQQGQSAAQRQLVGDPYRGHDASGDPLEVYLKGLAEWRKTASGMSNRRCLWCGSKKGLRSGTLPHVGLFWFCQNCEGSYRTCKSRRPIEVVEDAPELKVHLADAWGESSCGVGTQVTETPSPITVCTASRHLCASFLEVCFEFHRHFFHRQEQHRLLA